MLAVIALVVWLVALLVLAAFRMKPDGLRVIAGIFFIVMAIGVNGVVTLLNPDAFAILGSESLIPAYRDFFQSTVAKAPMVFGIALILFDLACGFLMLSKHRAVRYGIILAIAFLIALAPMSFITLTNLALAVVLARLLRFDFSQNLSEMWRNRKGMTRIAA